MRRLSSSDNIFQVSRSGAALMEVLIAILAMGIGVVSLMSLFPLSVVRTAQAHQMTVGTGFRLNAEEVFDTFPSIWIDPDNNGDPSIPSANPYYFIDPLGLNKGLASPFPGTTIDRYNAGFSGTAAIDLTVYSGNWLERHQDLVATAPAPTATSATLPGITLQNITNSADVRLVIFDATGKQSQIRTISQTDTPFGNVVADDDLVWDASLPAGFQIGQIRVESRDEQFTWLMTCRRTDVGTIASGDIFLAVFFRREFSAESESIYQYNAGANPVFTAGSTTATCDYTTIRPSIRKGGYVLDSDNGYWYRVTDYSEAGNTITMTLEFPAQVNSNGAVFFRGLVDVFFLGSKPN